MSDSKKQSPRGDSAGGARPRREGESSARKSSAYESFGSRNRGTSAGPRSTDARNDRRGVEERSGSAVSSHSSATGSSDALNPEPRGSSRRPRRSDASSDRQVGHGRRPQNAHRPGSDQRASRDDRNVAHASTREGVRPGKERAVDEPDAPDYDEGLLPFPVRAELRSLSPETAHRVGGHILAAGELVDVDPEQALKHAKAARRLAGRLPVVREVAAEVAYAAGEFDSALSDYRALHRMNGDPNYLPVIADCERALGRHQAALRTLRQAQAAQLSATQYVEAILVEAGVRADMGQRAEASRLLKKTIESGVGSRPEQARLRFAYANQLLEDGHQEQATKWFQAAERYDDEDTLDVASVLAELTGEERVADNDDFEIMTIELEDDEQTRPIAADEPRRAQQRDTGRSAKQLRPNRKANQ